MKRLIQYCAFIALFFIGISIVGAAEPKTNACSSPDQAIISLYDTKNSHGALWDDTTYNLKVCYDQIFKTKYAGSNPHNCNGNNLIVKLTSNSNAHAYAPGQNLNGVDICYGTLSCSVKLGECASDEKFILSLSNLTNAHIAADASYKYSLCCKDSSSGLPLIKKVYWANLSGNEIDNAGVNETVKLIAETDFPNGAKIQFEIFENDTSKSDSIRNDTSLLGTVSNGKAVVAWTISDSDINKADPTRREDILDFYFTAKKDSDIKQSETLYVERDRGGEASACRDDGNYWYDGETGSTSSTIDFLNACLGSDKRSGTSDDCCPIISGNKYQCTNVGNGYLCKPSTCSTEYVKNGTIYPIKLCSDYNFVEGNKEQQCINDCANAFNSAEQQAQIRNSGKTLLSNRCEWISGNSGGFCGIRLGTSGLDPDEPPKECFETRKYLTECINGERTAQTVWYLVERNELVPDRERVCCEDGNCEPFSISCGIQPLELPVFSLFNLVISLLVISYIYFVIKKNEN